MDQEAKYWRDKWLEAQRLAKALSELYHGCGCENAGKQRKKRKKGNEGKG